MSNLFYETGLFEFSEPNFIILNAFDSNDSDFGQQWSLKNTGQYGGTSGIDIKAEQAWTVSTGSNVKIAIVDMGIDLTHPDLQANLLPGYDASGNNSGGAPVWSTDNHGTACAGIAGAIKDNNLGISGVAPNCKIIPIHASNSLGGLPSDEAADAIEWAWQNGADVISNSWGGSSPYTPLTNAINEAVTQGRGGKGCIVVFAAGNDNVSTIQYPASLPNVIAVGAISPCGQRKSPTSCDGETCWGSNYGTNLSVVAPGVLIPTTDRQGTAGYNPYTPIYPNCGGTKISSDYADQNYTVWFDGTSAATPHVAGIAALILSVRPDLTQAQVRQAIESTCTKLSGYTFSTNSSQPNGTWNSEVGYGLVNAYAAVSSVALNITGAAKICSGDTATYTVNNLPAGMPVTWSSSSNLALISTTAATASFTTNGSGNGWVSVLINGIEATRDSISIGSPQIKITNFGSYGTSNTFRCEYSGGIGTVVWTTQGTAIAQLYDTVGVSIASFTFLNSGTHEITITATIRGLCGAPATASRTITVTGGNSNGNGNVFGPSELPKSLPIVAYSKSGSIAKAFKAGTDTAADTEVEAIATIAYPNPASNMLNVSTPAIAHSAQANGNSIARACTVRLYSGQGKLLQQTVTQSGNTAQFNVAKLPNGVYYVVISNGAETSKQTIVVSH